MKILTDESIGMGYSDPSPSVSIVGVVDRGDDALHNRTDESAVGSSEVKTVMERMRIVGGCSIGARGSPARSDDSIGERSDKAEVLGFEASRQYSESNETDYHDGFHKVLSTLVTKVFLLENSLTKL
jgi:hypothetical protein